MSEPETKPPLPAWAEREDCAKCGLPTYWNNAMSSSGVGQTGWTHTHSGACPSSLEEVVAHLIADSTLLRVALIEASEAVGRIAFDSDQAAWDAVPSWAQSAALTAHEQAGAAVSGAWDYASKEAVDA